MPEVPRIVQLALVAASVAMFVGSIVAVPWLIKRMPADHFVRPPKTHSMGTKVLRNAAGTVLVGLGIAMLVLPGQGVLAILFGISIMDLQIKHEIARSLLGRKHIRELLQRMRARAGQPPLVIPEHPVL